MNIDEFLDNAEPASTPNTSASAQVNAQAPQGQTPPFYPAGIPETMQTAQSSQAPQPSQSTMPKSPSASSSVIHHADNPQDQFDSLALSLETSLAAGDYQHAFDTYIAIQAALAHMIEQQKRQQKDCQERLAQFKKKVFDAVQVSSAQFQSVMQETYLHIGKIRELADAGDLENAAALYVTVKHTVEGLPAHLSEKRVRIEDDLIKVYLYLKDKKEQKHAQVFSTIAGEMKRLYITASAAIKSGNMISAQQIYEQLAAKYAQLPDGFTDEKVQLFDYVTFLHSQLNLPNAPVAQNAQTQITRSSTSEPIISSQSENNPRSPAGLRTASVPPSVPSPIPSSNIPSSISPVPVGQSISNARAPAVKPRSMPQPENSEAAESKAVITRERLRQPVMLDTAKNITKNIAGVSSAPDVQKTFAQASSLQSAQTALSPSSIELQKRAKELTARLEELKKTLEN